MKKSSRIIAVLLAALLCLFCVPTANNVYAASSKTLSINWNNIAAVGNQPKGSDACACYAVAYC